jgi:hypothetical protein
MYKLRHLIGLRTHNSADVYAKDYEFDFVPFRGLRILDERLDTTIKSISYNMRRKCFVSSDDSDFSHAEKDSLAVSLISIGYVHVSEPNERELRIKNDDEIDALLADAAFDKSTKDVPPVDFKEIIKSLIVGLEAQPGRRCHHIHLTEEDIALFSRYLLSNPIACNEDFYNDLLLTNNVVTTSEKLGKDVIFMGRAIVFGYPERKAVDVTVSP